MDVIVCFGAFSMVHKRNLLGFKRDSAGAASHGFIQLTTVIFFIIFVDITTDEAVD